MIYLKWHFAGGASLNVPLNRDGIVAYCEQCGKEIKVSDKDMLNIIENCKDFNCAIFTCESCEKKNKE